MVKKHKHSGTDRHYRKHQKNHARFMSFKKTCDNCVYRGRAGGINVYGVKACFNKKSKKYMKHLWPGQPACPEYELLITEL